MNRTEVPAIWGGVQICRLRKFATGESFPKAGPQSKPAGFKAHNQGVSLCGPALGRDATLLQLLGSSADGAPNGLTR